MKKILIGEGNPYKANLHCHSTQSNGKYTPAELKELYKAHGYSVLAITDHNGLFYHPELDDESFITLAGYETSFDTPGDFYSIITTHLCVYMKYPAASLQPNFNHSVNNPNAVWKFDEKQNKYILTEIEAAGDHCASTINTAVKKLREDGYIVTMCHPKWSRELFDVFSKYEGISNVEVFNTDSYLCGFDEYNGDIFDSFLRRNKRIHCVATDDNHRSVSHPLCDMFGGFTVFYAPSLSYENIILAFENGDFYASTGPLISELFYENGRVFIKTSTPVKFIRLLTGSRYSGIKMSQDEKGIYEADFEIPDCSVYFRLEAVAFDSTRAFTNGYFLDEIL